MCGGNAKVMGMELKSSFISDPEIILSVKMQDSPDSLLYRRHTSCRHIGVRNFRYCLAHESIQFGKEFIERNENF